MGTTKLMDSLIKSGGSLTCSVMSESSWTKEIGPPELVSGEKMLVLQCSK